MRRRMCAGVPATCGGTGAARSLPRRSRTSLSGFQYDFEVIRVDPLDRIRQCVCEKDVREQVSAGHGARRGFGHPPKSEREPLLS
jgi:hypothetical protein